MTKKAVDTKKEPLNPKQELPKVADTVTEKPLNIEIDVKPKNKIERLLIKAGFKPSKRLFSIKPQRVVNVYRIAGRAVKFNVEGILSDPDRIGTLMRLLAEYGEDIFYIVATAIQNDHREPTAKMIDIVRNEFEMDDLLKVMQVTVGNYNVNSFLNSIVLMTGVNALNLPSQTSPKENGR